MTNEKKLAAIMNVIKPYLEHEDGCNQTPYKQERFKEWIDALNDTPEKYRDEVWHDEYAKYNATHGICTCKHEQLIKELAPFCMELTDEEYILCAAIRNQGKTDAAGNPLMYCGLRHCNILWQGKFVSRRSDDQGFLTSKGRWVDRIEAMHIAKAARQLDPQYKDHLIGLFSEDLY